MKFSEQWLREWVNPDISTTDLAEQLTMAGLEVDAVEPVAPYFNNIAVGEVLSVEPHPDADRLRVCQVNVGGVSPLNIVCGAANVATGVPVRPAANHPLNRDRPEGCIKWYHSADDRPGLVRFRPFCRKRIAVWIENAFEVPGDPPVGKT